MQDWENYGADDDEDDPFCKTNTNSDFKCSEIKCQYRRQMDTGDPYDFSFSPVRPKDTGADTMLIAQGRAMLGFNRSTSSDYFIRGPINADTSSIADGAATNTLEVMI